MKVAELFESSGEAQDAYVKVMQQIVRALRDNMKMPDGAFISHFSLQPIDGHPGHMALAVTINVYDDTLSGISEDDEDVAAVMVKLVDSKQNEKLITDILSSSNNRVPNGRAQLIKFDGSHRTDYLLTPRRILLYKNFVFEVPRPLATRHLGNTVVATINQEMHRAS
jgi:hypothetical protein